MNFEKCIWDDRSRDIYHFSRKMLEKSNWAPETGEALLNAYEKERPEAGLTCITDWPIRRNSGR